MDPQAISKLLELGLPGIIIIALAIAYLNKDKKVDEINEKRIADQREIVKAIEQNTNTLETMAEVLKDRKGAS